MRKSFIILLLPILFISCTKDNPVLSDEEKPVNKALEIKIEEECKVSNKVWLKVSLSDTLSKPGFVNIWRGNEGITNFYFSGLDTIILDDKIKPGETVTYSGLIYSDTSKIYSNQLTTTTLDTTSHDMTWKMYDLGEGNEVEDIEILDENDIWAVGSFKSNNQSYNVVHWDGTQWTFVVLRDTLFDSQKVMGVAAIKIFNKDDIWLAGNNLLHYDGKTVKTVSNFPETISLKGIWGTGDNNLYIVGLSGAFYHYDGQKLEDLSIGSYKDFTYNIPGICGTPSGNYIWATFCDNHFRKSSLLNYHNSIIKTIYSGENYNGIVKDVWTNKENVVYIAFSNNLLAQKGNNKLDTIGIVYTTYPISTIYGTAENDIYLNNTRQLLHFNGATLREYSELQYADVWYNKVKAKGNICVIGGTYYATSRKGLVIIIKRN